MTIKKAALFLAAILLTAALHAQVRKKVHHSSLKATMARGKVVYNSICLACHMADGNGVPTMNPPIVKTEYVLGDKTRLIKIVLNGFKEDVQINGQSFSNNMTPHKDLTDRQIADVLTFVRKSFGNKASSISVLTVKKVRASNG
jgi:mono/diheme cytochrome c family protein